MTGNNSKEITIDHSFSVFMLGLTFGAIGALMLGTKEGRRITKTFLDELSQSPITDKIKNATKETLSRVGTLVQDSPSSPSGYRPPLPEPQYFEN